MEFIFECDVHGVECGHDVECADVVPWSDLM